LWSLMWYLNAILRFSIEFLCIHFVPIQEELVHYSRKVRRRVAVEVLKLCLAQNGAQDVN